MKKILIVLVTLLALSAMLLAADKDKQKKDAPCGDSNLHGMNLEKRMDMMQELNLTKDQTKKLGDLKAEHNKLMNTKQAEMENLMIDKRKAMQTDKYDQVKTLNKSIAELQLAIDNAMVDHHAAMLKELTLDQKEKFKEMMPMGMGMGMKGGMNKGMNCDMGKGPGKGMHKGMKMNCGGNCK